MDKILYQIHCRYNYALSNKLKASHLYCGYVKKNDIEPEAMDLFGELLKLAGYDNPEETQNKIYDYITKNIDDDEKLNILFSKFEVALKNRDVKQLPISDEWKNLINKIDQRIGRSKFNWKIYLTHS